MSRGLGRADYAVGIPILLRPPATFLHKLQNREDFTVVFWMYQKTLRN